MDSEKIQKGGDEKSNENAGAARARTLPATMKIYSKLPPSEKKK